jgi:hypothetical protein
LPLAVESGSKIRVVHSLGPASIGSASLKKEFKGELRKKRKAINKSTWDFFGVITRKREKGLYKYLANFKFFYESSIKRVEKGGYRKFLNL